MTGEVTPQADTSYRQDLSRSLSFRENILITLSAVTPASSVFIIVPSVIQGVAGASAVAFAIAAVVGVVVALCYAELSSAFPITGGEYAFVARTVGKATGFALYLLTIVAGILILGVIAGGTGKYLGVVWSALDGHWVGVVVIIATGLIAVLGIRTNAWVTGVFLVLELLALAVLAVLGFVNVTQPVSMLWTAQTAGPGGTLTAASAGLVVSYTAIAIFAYNGYGTAVYYAEETRQATRTIGRAILWSLAITVLAELVPLVAVLLGTPSMPGLVAAESPMNYFLLARGGTALNTIVSLGIAIAVINAVIAIMLQLGRSLYSAARDRSWPDAINRPLAWIHPRLRTPVVATLTVATLGALAYALLPFEVLLLGSGASLVITYVMVGLAALLGRLRGRTQRAVYRMPAWPLPPLLALAAMAVVIYENLRSDWIPVAITLVILAIGYAYYYACIRPRPDRWTLPDPVDED
ncbi:APC family permease [Saccharopolyspora indica]|uniref:APC family permease n=1 Tax=Saccharopolyspora indica TaxID=1229659 RepID=UPI0022EB9AC2|nr:APC family permease [Saccharopolyspora indica]MDA3643960.1 APC family permease [Saccharopolyspora indica]